MGVGKMTRWRDHRSISGQPIRSVLFTDRLPRLAIMGSAALMVFWRSGEKSSIPRAVLDGVVDLLTSRIISFEADGILTGKAKTSLLRSAASRNNIATLRSLTQSHLEGSVLKFIENEPQIPQALMCRVHTSLYVMLTLPE